MCFFRKGYDFSVSYFTRNYLQSVPFLEERCFTLTVQLFIYRGLQSNFFKNKHQCTPPPLFTWYCYLWFFLFFLTNKKNFELHSEDEVDGAIKAYFLSIQKGGWLREFKLKKNAFKNVLTLEEQLWTHLRVNKLSLYDLAVSKKISSPRICRL